MMENGQKQDEFIAYLLVLLIEIVRSIGGS